MTDLRMVLGTYLRVYGILSLAHIAMYIVLGHIHHLRRRARASLANIPSATVVVPVYNEDPDLLARCLESIDGQVHPCMQVVVVDDGSPNLADLEPVYARYSSSPGWTVFRLTSNVGKRSAQCVGFDAAEMDVIVTVDSDTVLEDPEALSTLVRSFLSRRVAAVTGAVSVSNRQTNVLTRLTALRYWMAFHQERAAQSLFGVMLCCSGPFSAYRRSVIQEVRTAYESQTFFGQRCTFGDDRHLTNLVLARGHRAIFEPDARASTHVPETWTGFLRQQVRWNKSFYRELLWSLRFVHRRNPYLALELSLQTLLPFMLIAALVTVGTRGVGHPRVAVTYALIVLGIAVARCAYGMLRTRSLRFLMFAAYGFIHVGLLLPARLHAIATLGRTHWGTRGIHRRPEASGSAEPVAVLRAVPASMPRQRVRGESTVVTVSDTRPAVTGIEPGATAPLVGIEAGLPIRDVLPELVRDRLGRWRPARTSRPTVVTVPRQRSAPAGERIDWALWEPATAGV